MNKKILLLGALSASLVLVGCGQQSQPESQSTPSTEQTNSQTPSDNTPSQANPDMPNPDMENSGQDAPSDMSTPPSTGAEDNSGAQMPELRPEATGTSATGNVEDMPSSPDGMGE